MSSSYSVSCYVSETAVSSSLRLCLSLPVTAIFLTLIISLSVLAWRHPTLPAHNATPQVHSVATRGRSFAYVVYLRGVSLAIYDWWARTSHNRTDRAHSIANPRVEHPTARAPSVRDPPVGSIRVSTRTPTPTPTAFTSSGEASTLETCVDSDAMELRELDESKSPSVSETDNGDIASVRHVGEPIVHVHPMSADYEPPLSPDLPTVEIDMVDASSSSSRVT